MGQLGILGLAPTVARPASVIFARVPSLEMSRPADIKKVMQKGLKLNIKNIKLKQNYIKPMFSFYCILYINGILYAFLPIIVFGNTKTAIRQFQGRLR